MSKLRGRRGTVGQKHRVRSTVSRKHRVRSTVGQKHGNKRMESGRESETMGRSEDVSYGTVKVQHRKEKKIKLEIRQEPFNTISNYELRGVG